MRVGSTHTVDTKRKMSLAKLGNKNGATSNYKKAPWTFIGTWSQYTVIHRKVRQLFGTPRTCENCGLYIEGKGIHWANVSGEYKLDRDDWQRLCAKCHFHLYRKSNSCV